MPKTLLPILLRRYRLITLIRYRINPARNGGAARYYRGVEGRREVAPREEREPQEKESVLGQMDDQKYWRIWWNFEEESGIEETGLTSG